MLKNISSESYERVSEAIEEIKNCCEIEDDYEEWYDIAQECMQQCFESLDDNQIEMTCAAWMECLDNTEDINLMSGLVCALEMCFEAMISFKEGFIAECDHDEDENENYDTSEAVSIKASFEKCLDKVRKVKKNIINQ